MSGTTDELKMPAASNKEDLISEMLSQQEIGDTANENDVSVCANCGKEGINLNICNKCKGAKYCNAACKKKHRSKHKKQCERRVAELHDEALFKQPPPEHGDCTICFLRLPTMGCGKRYMSCCGKTVCSGCAHAPVFDNHGNIVVGKKCSFCRTPSPTSIEESMERLEKRMEVGDEHAFFMMGNHSFLGEFGLPQDYAKATEFWLKAGKFRYTNLGHSYSNGWGVERDIEKAKHYFELGAIEGCVVARRNLGANEYNVGNYDRALKHHMIGVGGGDADPIKKIQRMYIDGHVEKDHYANALRSHQAYLNEIKSDQREKAAAFSDRYQYY